jgi:ABC-2 type transport system ATP-binding protein
MRVNEYLWYRGRLKGLLRKKLRSRLQEVCEQCGLESVRKRIIGHLSKGYRQRVGLADALIHEPELLILDEPTIGLDPNQIRQMRALIGNLATRHTVLLSTHILSEVEATCQRVLILHQGRIVASDTPANLKDLLVSGDRILAEIRAPRHELVETMGGVAGVTDVRCSEEGPWYRLELDSSGDEDLRPSVFDVAARHGWRLRELTLRPRSLEEVFAELTRDEEEEKEA